MSIKFNSISEYCCQSDAVINDDQFLSLWNEQSDYNLPKTPFLIVHHSRFIDIDEGYLTSLICDNLCEDWWESCLVKLISLGYRCYGVFSNRAYWIYDRLVTILTRSTVCSSYLLKHYFDSVDYDLFWFDSQMLIDIIDLCELDPHYNPPSLRVMRILFSHNRELLDCSLPLLYHRYDSMRGWLKSRGVEGSNGAFCLDYVLNIDCDDEVGRVIVDRLVKDGYRYNHGSANNKLLIDHYNSLV